MITKLEKNAGRLIAGCTIVILIFSTFNSNQSIQYDLGIIEPQTPVYDEKFVPAITKIASLIPKNETLVASGSGGIITLFTDFPVKTPRNITSQESLVEWMSKHKFNYLVVTPTNAPTLKPLFSKQGLMNLEQNFQKIIGFKTEFNEVHLFKRNLQ